MKQKQVQILASAATIAVSSFISVFAFQNCSPGFQTKNTLANQSSAGTTTGGTAPMPPTAPDLTPYTMPVVTIANPPPAVGNVDTLTFNISAKVDPRLKIQSLSCQLDANAPIACDTLSFTVSKVAEGDHSLTVVGTDTKAQTSQPQVYLFRVDKTAPVLTVSQSPSAITGSTTATIAFAATDSLSGVATYMCALDAAPLALCTSPVTSMALTSGAHTFRIQASDKAGNLSAISSVAWTVDLTAPTLTITSQPTTFSNSANANFIFSGTSGGVALASYQCSIDGGTFAACTSPKSYTALTEGKHTFSVKGTNAAGTMSSPVNASWTVDTTPPTAPVITLNVTSPSKSNMASVVFSSTDMGSMIAGFQCSVDGGTFASCTSPVALTGLTDGAHSFKVTASDNAGNTSTMATASLTIDTVVPVVTLTATPMATTTDTSASFSFTASDSGSGVKLTECMLDSGSFSTCASPATYSSLTAAAHSFQVRATDNAGNQKTVSYAWMVNLTTMDGATLYANNCASCHGALASSTKLGRTSAQISGAISSVASMNGLISLTPAQIDAISAALTSSTGVIGNTSGPIYSCADATTRGISDKGSRRLTYREFNNTLTDLLGATVMSSIPSLQLFPPDTINQDVSEFTPLHSQVHAQAIMNISFEAAQALVANRTALNAVAPACIGTGLDAGSITDTCLTQFLNSFGRRALRRTLTAAQIASYLADYKTTTIATLSTSDRLTILIARVLESPQLHFMMEVTTGVTSGTRLQVDPFTVASRLSYAVTGSMPDDTLLNAAAAGQLATTAQVKAQAQRLMATAGGHRQFRDIVYFWMRMGTLAAPATATLGRFGLASDATTANRLLTEARNEALDYAETLVFTNNATFQDLMNSNLMFPKSQDMAKILGVSTYNVAAGVPSTDGRKGLLMKPAILMSNLERERPIHRGNTIRTRFLCDVIPPPPANVDNLVMQSLTTINPLTLSERDVVTSITSSTSCQSCHSLMNPIGFTLGAFGPLAERRTTEKVYDTTGALTATLPINTTVQNVNVQTASDAASGEADLLTLVSGSSKAQACMGRMVFRFSHLRNETADDSCLMSDQENLVRSNTPIQNVLLNNVSTDDIFWKGQ